MNAPVVLRPDETLSRADIAAIAARENWLDQAWDPEGRAGKVGKQIPPPGNWSQLIFRAGRGFGKTRSETEWMFNEAWRCPIVGHAVAPTLSDCRGTLFLGPAGFRSIIPAECLAGENWEYACDISHLEIKLKNGSLIRGFGAKDAGARLRGPQCHAAIGDELREWDTPKGNLEGVHTNMMFGLRLRYPDGSPSRAVMGTTPKAIPYLQNLYRDPKVLVVTGSSYENVHNLSDTYRDRLFSLEGTKVARVEIHGEDIDSEEGAIFQRKWFRLWPAGKKLPEFQKILISLDTAMSDENYDPKTEERDYSACAVLGVFNTRQCFTEIELKRMGVRSKYAALLVDFWMERLGFPDLLEKARETYRTKWGSKDFARRADVVLIENKQSGISLRQVLMTYGVPTWPYNPKRQSKTMRANASAPMVLQGMLFVPESGLPDCKGQVRNWAEPVLEQMCSFAGEGSIRHDDALDSIVQAMLYFMETGVFHAEPQGRAYPDQDEEDERKMREAERQAERENRKKESAYGA